MSAGPTAAPRVRRGGQQSSAACAILPLQIICAFERGLKPSLHAPPVPRGDLMGGSTAGSKAGYGGEASPGGLSFEQIRLDAVSKITSCDIEER